MACAIGVSVPAMHWISAWAACSLALSICGVKGVIVTRLIKFDVALWPGDAALMKLARHASPAVDFPCSIVVWEALPGGVDAPSRIKVKQSRPKAWRNVGKFFDAMNV